ncbi:acyl-CoA dehydrogenase family protein [Caldimonas brevitalea]|uniref:Butyryl-CoA dehydrogenase n=1 Tax=Caldimonas brevitalea TaxID=413882 RepID=A0A0G3BHX4_9BURK|nr:acyl-CoA dehydrogenase family protein [Caldimonas brevitalea]AKJ29039.1 butyryl-CoA dehydrogenase [Caldimonas brevitalea]
MHAHDHKSALTPEALKQWLREYAAQRFSSPLMDERRMIPPDLVLDFGNMGLLGMQVSPSDGGLGFSNQAFVAVLQQLAAIDPTLCLFVGLSNILGIRPLEQYGTADCRQRWLGMLAQGRQLGAFALTEPEAGSNPVAMQTTAVLQDGKFVLNGVKHWIGNASWCSVLYVFAKSSGEQGESLGITAFAVDRGLRGVTVGPEARTMGMRAASQSRVTLRNVEVPETCVLGTVGGGLEVAQDTLMRGRLVIASAAVGTMKRCAQLMLRYARRRHISTGRLLDNTITRERLTVLNHQITAVEALTGAVAAHLDAGVNVPTGVFAACKIAATEYLDDAADKLMQLLGGRGYIEPNIVPQIYRDARLLRIFEGPTETLANYLGSVVLKQPGLLQDYLATHFRTGDLFSGHLEVLAQLKHVLAERAGSLGAVDKKVKLRDVAGHLTSLLMLQAAVPPDSATRAWLQSSYERHREELEQRAGLAVCSSDELASLIAGFDRDIGDVEQAYAGEDHQLDPYLAKGDGMQQSSTQHAGADGWM